MKLAYDVRRRKVGCPLLQASMGGDARLASILPEEDWLLIPTPNLKVYELTAEQWMKLRAFHEHKISIGEADGV